MPLKKLLLFNLLLAPTIFSQITNTTDGTTVEGELKKWHKLTLNFEGPMTQESASINPFSDYRLDVTFTHTGSGKTYEVPGYYAADGNADNTGATSGNIWHAHFSPSEVGDWEYKASFRQGVDIAISQVKSQGVSAGYFDGDTGVFEVEETDKSGADFRGKGRLEYVNKHHLQFAETGEYFLKAGPDAPENMLAYDDFDSTPNDPNGNSNLRKSWSAHAGDYVAAEASEFLWQSDKGSELLGAVNYLASEELNVMSFLTFNIDGDDDNVFPHLLVSDTAAYEAVSDNGRWNADPAVIYKDRFDVSKMAQWENILEYAQRKGIYLHFKTQETENDDRMDGGTLGRERKLYYRELIARFSHHLALNWNLGEENTNSDQERKDFAQWFNDIDPYHHNIVIHSYPGQKDAVYTPLLGSASALTGASLQTNNTSFLNVFSDTLNWVNKSADSGKPWIVACDEPGDASAAVRPDDDAGSSHRDGRINALWGNIMAGGAGCEFYFGYKYSHSDLTCQDFRSRDDFWDYCRHALNFFSDNDIPFQELSNENALVSSSGENDNRCLAKAGLVYVIQLDDGGVHTLDLSSEAVAPYVVQWYNPRTGGSLIQGDTVMGGGIVSLGSPPNSDTEDWISYINITDTSEVNTAPSVDAGSDVHMDYLGQPITLNLDGLVTDDGAPSDYISHSWKLIGDSNAVVIAEPSLLNTTVTFNNYGEYTLRLSATDDALSSYDDVIIDINNPFLVSSLTTFTPIDDAYTQNGQNHNNAGLRVENSPSRERISYLKFDTSTLNGGIDSAILHLTEGTDTSSGVMTYNLFLADSTEWSENTITGGSAPNITQEIGSKSITVTNGSTLEFDVTAYVQNPGEYTFIVTTDSSSLDVEFSSSEGEAPPRIEVVSEGYDLDSEIVDFKVESLENGEIKLNWNGGDLFNVEGAETLSGSWTSISGGSPLVITIPSDKERYFYRLSH